MRLGRFAGLRGPGLFYIIPGVEHVLFVDRRLLTLDIPGQKAITRNTVLLMPVELVEGEAPVLSACRVVMPI